MTFFLGTNSVKHISIDILVNIVYSICEIVEKTLLAKP